MNYSTLKLSLAIALLSICQQSIASVNIDEVEDRLELETSYIKGNKELPQVLYIVPWQKNPAHKNPPKHIRLHSLFGDIYQPLTEPLHSRSIAQPAAVKPTSD